MSIENAIPETEPARYDEQLEKLLTELALKTRAIRDLEAKK